MKTDKKWLAYLEYGKFRGRLTFLYCNEHAYLHAQNDSEVHLRKYIPQLQNHDRGKSPYSMDVVCFVGMAKFIHNLRQDRIEEELRQKFRLSVSDGTVSNLSTEFIVRFYLYHEIHFFRITNEIKSSVGYIMGMDGTGDGNTDRIILFMDLLRNWVLKSIDVPSEGSEYVKPHLQELVDLLGEPLLDITDASSGFDKAHMDVIQDVPHRYGSYHILKDIGCALFMDNHVSLKKLLKEQTCTEAYLRRLRKIMKRRAEIKNIPVKEYAGKARDKDVPNGALIDAVIFSQAYDVVSWILRYYEDNKGMRFPFVLPRLNFYTRCKEALEAIREIRRMVVDENRNPKFLLELETKLKATVLGTDERSMDIRRYANELEADFLHFSALRNILDIPDDKGDIPRDRLIIENNEKIRKMKQELQHYYKDMNNLAEGGDEGARIICGYIDKYRDSLIMENIAVIVDGEEILVEIPRTTSQLEVCFGGLKSDIRKRQGKMDTGPDLSRYHKYLGILQNLKSESYVKLMFGSLDLLPEVLSRIPKDVVDEEMRKFREMAMGYDITNNSRQNAPLTMDDIMKGIKYVSRRVEESMMQYGHHPPEAYGKTSWDCYRIQDPSRFRSQVHT